MKIKLVGFSRFQSKKGTDCLIIGYAFADDRWSGLRVESCFVSPSCVSGSLVVGNEYDISFDMNGRVISLCPCK